MSGFWRQLPNPGHAVEVRTDQRARPITYQPWCHTCGHPLALPTISFGTGFSAARVHVDGVRCCEGGP